MSDLFHEDIPEEYIRSVFEVMERADWHIFQVLTKRHERLAKLAPTLPWPKHVWAGVTIENNPFAHRADFLRHVPAAVRFISAEPLLGPLPDLCLEDIDWLITGGESGPIHRAPRQEWFTDLRDRCAEAGVAFFFKQWGGRTSKSGGRVLEGAEWSQMPTPTERQANRPPSQPSSESTEEQVLTRHDFDPPPIRRSASAPSRRDPRAAANAS
jgi:protein gp37